LHPAESHGGNRDGDDGGDDHQAHIEGLLLEVFPGHCRATAVVVAKNDIVSEDVRDGAEDTVWQAVLVELALHLFVVGIWNGSVLSRVGLLGAKEDDQKNGREYAPSPESKMILNTHRVRYSLSRLVWLKVVLVKLSGKQ